MTSTLTAALSNASRSLLINVMNRMDYPSVVMASKDGTAQWSVASYGNSIEFTPIDDEGYVIDEPICISTDTLRLILSIV